MSTSNPPPERHPRWIVRLAILLCLAALGAMVLTLIRGEYAVAVLFFFGAIVAALLPRIRNLLIKVNPREPSATVAVNAPSGGVRDPANGNETASGDEPDVKQPEPGDAPQ
jgi:hypothetical protein